MGTAIDYRTNTARKNGDVRGGDEEHSPRRLSYVRTWRRTTVSQKPRHRRSNRWS
ncbi:MAG TPA: hypothetical protein VFE24_11615 [Pirellulales bacterium]|jgi:hypothetical protein|nr:hypothetical protein [Pirellulales bacterium]